MSKAEKADNMGINITVKAKLHTRFMTPEFKNKAMSKDQ